MKKTVNYIYCALFAALTAVCSQIIIPLAPVPVNLATLSVFVAGGILGAKLGAVSQVVYVLLGAFGVPVFAMFTGGMGKLIGPTGGYIIGYVAAAWLTGFLIERWGGQVHTIILAMVLGLSVCYILGTTWFMFVTKTGLVEALMMCVVPFLVGDALKIAVGTTLVHRLRTILSKRGMAPAV
ncbi:biotin transporter BioY [Clostridium minihomine]|uniref:biotin transporter BioY n=1 Tax=Clostridium minihomine TaxID=2045012 RepID=UPI000C77F8B3|nr:biotin transporter BioY [Clostridium minihomine]